MDSSGAIKEDFNCDNVLYSEKARVAVNSANYRNFWEGNIKYRDASSFLMLLINIQMVVIVIMTIGLYFYVSKELPRDGYYMVSDDSKVSSIMGLDRPNNSVDTLADWVSSAVVEVMTFGFNDIDERFEISKQNFTKDGWEAFRKALLASGMIDNVINNKQMVTAAPVTEPVLLKDGYIRGSYKWMFQMQIMITYRSGSEKKNDTRRVNVFVERIPTEENPRGVGIAEWSLM